MVINHCLPCLLKCFCHLICPHGAYPCPGEDRWCVIAVFTDEEWKKLCKAIGEPDWTKDPKFSTLLSRKQNEDELDRLISEWTLSFHAEEIMIKLQSVGAEAAVVKKPKEMYEDQHLKHYLWAEMEHPEIGKYNLQLPSFRLSEIPPELRRPSPLLGEHNEYVYTNLGGFSAEEYIQLRQEGVFD